MADYKAVGILLDDIFEPRVTAPITDTDFVQQGVDLANRYEKRTSAPVGSSMFEDTGVDLATLFQGKPSVPLTKFWEFTLVSGPGPRDSRNAL